MMFVPLVVKVYRMTWKSNHANIFHASDLSMHRTEQQGNWTVESAQSNLPEDGERGDHKLQARSVMKERKLQIPVQSFQRFRAKFTTDPDASFPIPAFRKNSETLKIRLRP